MIPQNIVLLHGRGGKPTGSVAQLEECLRPHFPDARYERPALLHGDPEVTAQASLAGLRAGQIPHGAVVIGVSLGGLVAAKLQEESRDDLTVICISSPTWADEVRLTKMTRNRTAFYSSHDEVIVDRVDEWPLLAASFDIPWLTHDTDRHKAALSRLIVATLADEDLPAVIAALSATDQGRAEDLRQTDLLHEARRRVAAWMRRQL